MARAASEGCVVLICFRFLLGMPWTPSSRPDPKRRPGKGSSKGEGVHALKQYQQYQKQALRPYLSSEGQVLFAPWGSEKAPDQELLSCTRLREDLNSSTCEMLHRPNVGLSEMCSNLRHGMQALRTACGGDTGQSPLGLGKALRMLEAFPELEGALNVLDRSGETEVPRSRQSVLEACQVFVRWLIKDPERLSSRFVPLTLAAGQLYLLGSTVAQLAALASDVEVWGNQLKLQEHLASKPGWEAWLIDVGHGGKLASALAAECAATHYKPQAAGNRETCGGSGLKARWVEDPEPEAPCRSKRPTPAGRQAPGSRSRKAPAEEEEEEEAPGVDSGRMGGLGSTEQEPEQEM